MTYYTENQIKICVNLPNGEQLIKAHLHPQKYLKLSTENNIVIKIQPHRVKQPELERSLDWNKGQLELTLRAKFNTKHLRPLFLKQHISSMALKKQRLK